MRPTPGLNYECIFHKSPSEINLRVSKFYSTQEMRTYHIQKGDMLDRVRPSFSRSVNHLIYARYDYKPLPTNLKHGLSIRPSVHPKRLFPPIRQPVGVWNQPWPSPVWRLKFDKLLTEPKKLKTKQIYQYVISKKGVWSNVKGKGQTLGKLICVLHI